MNVLNELIQYIKTHAFDYKTKKSLYNILIGAKTQQTYFDACSQELLSLYHSQPELKYPTFERYYDQIQQLQTSAMSIEVNNRHTYESIQTTFQVIQLLIQTFSHGEHHTFSFIPVSQLTNVQEKTKKLFNYIKQTNQEIAFKNEIYDLFKKLNSRNCHSIIHYFLQGFDETMYTNQQVTLIEHISEEELFVLKMNDLVEIIQIIEDENSFPILNQTILLPTLSQNAKWTYTLIMQGYKMVQIADIEKVKVNTIEDHILELFIKGYLHDYSKFEGKMSYQLFKNFYLNHPGQKLKHYKTAFPEMSFFEIKLAMVRIAREGK